MTKIRLARTGSTHQPHYRIVVADSRNRRDGRFIEILGSYHPLQGGDVTVNKDRASYWISVGAQPSNTVISLLSKAGVEHKYQVRRKPQRVAEKPAETAAPVEVVEEAAPEADNNPSEGEAIEEAPLSDEAAAESSEQPEATKEAA